MSNYTMPEGMRPATLQEREEFYRDEFNIDKMTAWLKFRPGPTKFAVIIGRHTKIFPQAYQQDASTTIIIDEYTNLADIRVQIVEFLPEAVYYDRNIYTEKDKVVGQELAFDVDPENIACPVHGTLADKLKRRQGLGFCMLELEIAKQQTIGLYEYLEKQFLELRVVYSGRGFHIHVLDEKAYALPHNERRNTAKTVKARGFDIDAWVTEGEMRLIRLPYSLNGLVSRIVLPLDKNEVASFNPTSDDRCIPAFLKR